jgi:hypothetical protein
MAIPFLQQPAFQHRLSQLLNEHRHAIGASENLVHHLLRQCRTARHPLDQCRAVVSAKACERNRRHVGVIRPRRREFWSRSDEQQHPKLRHVLHYGADQLERGWIDPVDIFENHENWLPCRRPLELSQ